MEAHDILQAAHNTINHMLLETIAVAAGEEQVEITKQRHAETDKGVPSVE